jgi:uncharacterized protein (TIGR02118 family)
MFRTPKDTAAFDEHYFETHVALAKMLPGLRKYEILQGPAAIDDDAFHLVSTFHFDTADAANWALESPEGKAAEADRRSFVPDDNDVLMFLIDSQEAYSSDESFNPGNDKHGNDNQESVQTVTRTIMECKSGAPGLDRANPAGCPDHLVS